MQIVLNSDDLFEKIKHHLKYNIPLSIIRYGDGEAMTLNGLKDYKSYNSILKRQLGYSPSIDHAEEIRENLIEAYINCDVLGIPLTNKTPEGKEDYWSKSVDILKDNVGINTFDKKELTTIDCHSHFLDRNYYKELMTDLKIVNYISCRNLDEEIKKTFNVKQVNSFIIAPEKKFTSGYVGNNHYPEQFIHIKKWMERAVPCEGNLCLVGAGFVGKIYNNWFRDLGGISMDIGSVMDSWAGKATRGKDRGLDKEDLVYKL